MIQQSFIDNINIHPDWSDFLTKEILEELFTITKLVNNDLNGNSKDLCPSADKVLRFLNIPAKKIKVIIIGQDPYPQNGVATGRAFEVNGLKSWQSPFKNPSLQNIIRSVFYSQTGKLLKFSEIRKLLENSIEIHPPDKIFSEWENQGVLLLNKALTCKLNSPGSHTELWEDFTMKLISYINEKLPDAIWFAWGNHALESIDHLKPKNIIFSYHPSRCQQRENDFLYGNKNCFKETSDSIDWLGYRELPSLF